MYPKQIHIWRLSVKIHIFLNLSCPKNVNWFKTASCDDCEPHSINVMSHIHFFCYYMLYGSNSYCITVGADVTTLKENEEMFLRFDVFWIYIFALVMGLFIVHQTQTSPSVHPSLPKLLIIILYLHKLTPVTVARSQQGFPTEFRRKSAKSRG